MRTRPWTMLVMMLAGWLNRHHQDVIEYLKEENKILREKSAKRRMEIRTSRTRVETGTINDWNIAYGDAVQRVPPLAGARSG